MNKSSDVCCTNTCQNANNEKVSKDIKTLLTHYRKLLFKLMVSIVVLVPQR